jgi:hypothetical protein
MKIKQTDIAKKAGSNQATISNILTGRRRQS